MILKTPASLASARVFGSTTVLKIYSSPQNLYTMTLITDTFSGCDWMKDKLDIFTCCSSNEPCGIYEGHCSNDNECQGK